MDTEPAGKPATCNNCAYYYITHDAHLRYGCRALDFKSERQPVLVVVEASGQQCQFFKAKEKGSK